MGTSKFILVIGLMLATVAVVYLYVSGPFNGPSILDSGPPSIMDSEWRIVSTCWAYKKIMDKETEARCAKVQQAYDDAKQAYVKQQLNKNRF